ncbi:MAG: tRNA (uridine(34)/cytosine(34)/5-carboxymethylaminomethyluridine(34)-2'-O)-methyltransferase TrmL [Clostridia bacterium]|jgi:tRNA (cytidine/uridine-2'-O-)-methyltransferase|nr:tRNA (uridine(34)/cytosine(34)/5-carboxymethylaminomethyluridine(34)-2'-O)-methyltransferase TrmL [Clostridia bacterium]
MLHIVLYEPEIPQNTGNIARTCAATGASLDLIKPLGFALDDKKMKRAGLDYWHLLDVKIHENLQAFYDCYPGAKVHYFSTKSRYVYTEVEYEEDAFLMFGPESRGLPEELLLKNYDKTVRLPMREDARSLNLSNTVAVAVYEAMRQKDFVALKKAGKLTKYDV